MESHNLRASAPKLDGCEELSLLTSMVSHYLINAFAGAVSHLELLAVAGEQTDCGNQGNSSQTIIDSAMQAASVARQLSGFASSLIPRGTDEVRLHELVADAVARKRAEDEETQWVLDVEPVPTFLGDARLLDQMLNYLFDNAREAARAVEPSRRIIRVRLQNRPDAWLVLEVANPGAPLDESVSTRGFEPFFSTREGGKGIGLTLAKAIWRRHHGSMSLSPIEGGGAIASLRMAVMNMVMPPHAVGEAVD